MATPSRKATTSNTTENKNVAQVDTEKEDLKKQLEELKSQMAAMSKLLDQTQSAPAETKEVKKDRQIKFINMTNGTLVLKGNSIYTIEGQFNTRSFTEKEALLILNNCHGTIEQGFVYIADAQFVKDNDLDYIYENILNEKQLKELFNKRPEDVIEIYKNASKGQKDIIIRMIEERKENGIPVDANILIEIGKLANRDLMTDYKE